MTNILRTETVNIFAVGITYNFIKKMTNIFRWMDMSSYQHSKSRSKNFGGRSFYWNDLHRCLRESQQHYVYHCEVSDSTAINAFAIA